MFGTDLHKAAFAEYLRREEPALGEDGAMMEAEVRWPYMALHIAVGTLGDHLSRAFEQALRSFIVAWKRSRA